MAEYIEREALMAKIDAWEESARNGTNPNCKNGNEYEAAMDIAIMVEEAPTANVRENVTGEWIRISHRDCFGYKCSACGEIYNKRKNRLYYCPNCGAEMGGGDGDG